MSNNQNKSNNINNILNKGLCTGCGICKSICPFDCIEFKWNSWSKMPKINVENCSFCGKCFEICPGKKIGSDICSTNDFYRYLGRLEESFLIDSSERFKDRYTASGGFVVSFLSYLLDNSIISRVLAVSLEGDDLKSAKSITIDNSSDLKKISGSIYFKVPLDIGLKELLNKPGKFAVVGLPCQIRGIDNLEQESKEFRDKIYIKIGIFCGFMIGYRAAKFLMETCKIMDGKKIKKISFRARKGDDEGFLIETSDEEYFISKSEYMLLLNRIFSDKRCLMCNDMTNERADVSCGDAHKFGYKKSVVICRNEKIVKLINNAKSAGYLNIYRAMSPSEVFASQESILKYKKDTIKYRLEIMNLLNRAVPEAALDLLPESTFVQKVGSLLFISNCYITGNGFTRRLFFLLPNRLIKSYSSFVYNLLQGRIEIK